LSVLSTGTFLTMLRRTGSLLLRAIRGRGFGFGGGGFGGFGGFGGSAWIDSIASASAVAFTLLPRPLLLGAGAALAFSNPSCPRPLWRKGVFAHRPCGPHDRSRAWPRRPR
jgi:hypothetical protein